MSHLWVIWTVRDCQTGKHKHTHREPFPADEARVEAKRLARDSAVTSVLLCELPYYANDGRFFEIVK
jgi:hypothetical protein